MKIVVIALLAAVSGFSQENRKVIPYIAQDEHSSTWIHAINACSKTVSYHLAFESMDGPESFSLENNEGLWQGIRIEEMEPRSNHFWALPKTVPGTIRAGYAVVEDDGGGCVSFDLAYGEEVDAGDLRVALGFVSETSATGVVQPFLNSTGCDTGVAVVGSGGEVSLEATDWNGNMLGSSTLGNVRYRMFLASQEFPRAVGEDGLIQITGGDVASLGFIVCNERLSWSRRSYPIPGAVVSTAPGGLQYEVVEFATKRLGEDYFGSHKYAYKLTLRNPTNVEHTYSAELLFRDSSGFVLERVWVQHCTSFCFYASTLRLGAGRTGTLEGVRGEIRFDADPRDVTVEVEVNVVR